MTVEALGGVLFYFTIFDDVLIFTCYNTIYTKDHQTMPRKNNTPKHTPHIFVNHEAAKRRFATKQQAQKAAKHQLLVNNIELFVYQSDVNRGWYLTRKSSTD